MKIAFYVNVWERTYENVLLNGFLENILDIINYKFDEKTIIINNIRNIHPILEIIGKKFNDFNIHLTEKDLPNKLEYFNLTKQDISSTYWTALPPLTALYYTTADYLFHIEEDCVIKKWNEKFIGNAISVMEGTDSFMCAMPDWTENSRGAKGESLFEDDEFYYAQGFTEQFFMIPVQKFKQDIYHENNALSDRYPPQSFFERKVDSYMRNHEKFRIIDKNSYYLHGEQKF
jgi:hypothetical protein